MAAFDPKRTFSDLEIYVRFTPESGHIRRVRLMSAFDPKQTFIGICGSAGDDQNSAASIP